LYELPMLMWAGLSPAMMMVGGVREIYSVALATGVAASIGSGASKRT
jgi:uncharacterized protein (UPF0254 family)